MIKIFASNKNEILFIDDVASVAENAKKLNTPFIGGPSTAFQELKMIEAGVEHLVYSIREIDKELLLKVDKKAASGKFWDTD